MTINILVVDDNRDNRELLVTICERLKIADTQVLEAETGAQALDIAFRKKPALILLDMMMPGLSGCEVCSIVKNNTHLKGTQIIMLTAADSKEHRAQAQIAGVDKFISKPFDLMLLRECIRQALEPLISASAVQET